MEVKINKEIREYTESMFFGLSMRQFFFSGLGVGMAIAVYFVLKSFGFGTETVSWACMLSAAPFIAMGFVTYNGMTAEQLALTWIKSKFIEPIKVKFECETAFNKSNENEVKTNGKKLKGYFKSEKRGV